MEWIRRRLVHVCAHTLVHACAHTLEQIRLSVSSVEGYKSHNTTNWLTNWILKLPYNSKENKSTKVKSVYLCDLESLCHFYNEQHSTGSSGMHGAACLRRESPSWLGEIKQVCSELSWMCGLKVFIFLKSIFDQIT